MHTTKKTTPVSSNPTEPAPVAPKKKRHVLTPSVVTSYLAAVAQDVTSPTPMVSVTPTVPSTGTASADCDAHPVAVHRHRRGAGGDLAHDGVVACRGGARRESRRRTP